MKRPIRFTVTAIALMGAGLITACQSESATDPSDAASPDSEAVTETLTDTPDSEADNSTEADLPDPSIDDAPATLSERRSGIFVAGEHNTLGTAELIEDNGSVVLAFSPDFQTIQNAPDPVIVLHTSADVIGSTTPPTFPLQEGDYVEIAVLQSPSGAQQYTIPETVDAAQYGSVVIWCRKFNATFAAAPLQ
ncbi:MAG: DM13 domain-containing protein [Cyanobacteria bacterium P01_A01_bin.37]